MFGREALENYAQAIDEALILKLQSDLSAKITSLITMTKNLHKNTTITTNQKSTELKAIKSSYDNLCGSKKFVEQKVFPWIDKNTTQSTTELKEALTLTLSRFSTLDTWIGLVSSQCDSVKVQEPAPKPKRGMFSCLS